MPADDNSIASYWSLDPAALVAELRSSAEGLSANDAATRLEQVGPNRLAAEGQLSRFRAVGVQLKNPLLLILVVAGAASAFTGEWVDATMVLAIVVISAGISAVREYRANAAIEALRSRVRTLAQVCRSGATQATPVDEVVPGDVVLLSAGSLVPADGVLLDSTDLYVSEAVLTGESFPVEKHPGVVSPQSAIRDRTNCVFLGTNVRSGLGRCLVARTGASTEFGHVATRLTLQRPATEFERGMRRFSALLSGATVMLVLLVSAMHLLGGRPPIETLLFSVALAVGLSPELLPAILSVNLARSAQAMARHGVIVRRLDAIENLGCMDVLCTDKTGTITEGVMQLEGSYDPRGAPASAPLEIAAINAALETGLGHPLDDAIAAAHRPDLSAITKIGEIPFDFVRKRVSVIVRDSQGARLISKGAFEPLLEVCRSTSDGRLVEEAAADLRGLYDGWTGRGLRVIGVATRTVDPDGGATRAHERDLTFAGFLTFLDRPKPGVAQAIADLARAGVSIKLITGDSALVAQHLAGLVGLRRDRILTGRQLGTMNDEALWHRAEQTDLFVEVDPNQKERIILALKRMGHVVGFLGDGVNDAPAMHAADTSLSVDDAVDVARAAADFVLLEQDLDVIRQGIGEGRKTFANTMKYLLTTTSANLGNMVSMAVASLALPFLPLLPSQILLNNVLSDIPAIGLADDNVDRELVERPEHWDIGLIRRFMVEFGALSSVFDALTFLALLLVFHATPDLFRTGWFVESLLTELAIVLVVRTRGAFFRSRPATLLLTSTGAVAGMALALPYLPVAAPLGFVPLPLPLLFALCAITVAYVLASELTKRWFFRSGPPEAQRGVVTSTVISPSPSNDRASARIGHQS